MPGSVSATRRDDLAALRLRDAATRSFRPNDSAARQDRQLRKANRTTWASASVLATAILLLLGACPEPCAQAPRSAGSLPRALPASRCPSHVPHRQHTRCGEARSQSLATLRAPRSHGAAEAV